MSKEEYVYQVHYIPNYSAINKPVHKLFMCIWMSLFFVAFNMA
jgi:hypothetical protein